MTAMIALPKRLSRTRSMQYSSVDTVLAMALTLRIHGTAEAVRQTALNLRTKVCMEHQPKMKTLAKLENDREVLCCALMIVSRATDALGILPGQMFEFIAPQDLEAAPSCHYKPMRLAGQPGTRHWQCQHCSHTKPIGAQLERRAA